MRRVLSLALLTLGATLAAASLSRPDFAAATSAPLRRVVLAHRHGARTPTSNTDGACDQIGCGTLTEQGALMLRSLGMAFRVRYGDILPSTYYGREVSSKSDTSGRVLQSASAFLNGLYAYNASYRVYPAIDANYGNIIDLGGVGAREMHEVLVAEKSIVKVSEEALKIVNRSDVVKVGEEIKLNGLECDVVPQLCIAKAIDFLESMKAEGKLGEFPIGAALLPKLQQVRLLLYNAIYFEYDVSSNNTYFAEAGYQGAELYLNMLHAMWDGPPVSEYSGHDTTLMPLYVAMGNETYAYPDFATALVFEVYGTNSSDQFVRPLVGTCDQYPGSHPYTFTPYAITCMNAQHSTYVTEEGCPLADLKRFASTRVGSKALPNECYAWPEDLADNLCNGDEAQDPKLPCGKYRQSCPLYACGPGRYMTPDLACHPIGNNSTN